MTILVTGGSGFIGSNFILNWIKKSSEKIINVDKLTYAGNEENLENIKDNDQYVFIKSDINDCHNYKNEFLNNDIRAVINFAAESHVDRSISSPSKFMQTNIIGTFNLLETSKKYWNDLSEKKKKNFRFVHVSTDEVYGSLSLDEQPFTENNKYKPNSPYSASKASSDHLVRVYNKTYNFPTLITNCSNNYGPFQYPEKLIPLVINNAIREKPLPIYGDGKQIRDWLYVEDHCNAIIEVLNNGFPFEVYNIGGNNEIQNIDIAIIICEKLDILKRRDNGKSYKELISFVKDRPGHDTRYAINNAKIKKELNWSPNEDFKSGISRTIDWYLKNQSWVENIYKKNQLLIIR